MNEHPNDKSRKSASMADREARLEIARHTRIANGLVLSLLIAAGAAIGLVLWSATVGGDIGRR